MFVLKKRFGQALTVGLSRRSALALSFRVPCVNSRSVCLIFPIVSKFARKPHIMHHIDVEFSMASGICWFLAPICQRWDSFSVIISDPPVAPSYSFSYEILNVPVVLLIKQ